MRKILLLAICLFAFNVFGQYEDDTSEFYTEYILLDYSAKTLLDFEPTEENIEWDRYTKVIYNPIVNYDVIDSILNWRESKGYSKIQVDWDQIDKKMRDYMYFEGMDISKAESDKVTLGRFEDTTPDCDCAESIVSNILDDSLTYMHGKSEKSFNSYLLDPKIKRIEVYYYQVDRKNEPDKNESHLIVKIKKKYRLFAINYQIF